MLGVQSVSAQVTDKGPVADFYRGKTINGYIGTVVGGEYDQHARLIFRFMGKYIPGNPTMVPQNMPGAGGVKAMNYLYNVARKDGTVIGTFSRGLAIEPLLGHAQGTQFQAAKFGWIGSVTNEVSVCAFWTASGIKSWQDVQTKNSVIGASAAGADSEIFPVVMRNMFKLPVKVVTGFSGGGADINLGMERGEVNGRCGWSWSSLLSQAKPLLDQKKISVVIQFGLEKHEDLPNVPLIMDLATTPENKAALRLITSRQSIARPFAAPPGIPPERLAALRAAFDATMKDPQFLAEAKRLDLEVRPVNGAAVQKLIEEVYATPADVVKLAAAAERSR